ncbi:MAG: flavodoxin family protein [Candidatus Omnitrophota bacterium]
MMTVLGICGSPRRAGLTEALLDAALEGARSRGAATEKLILSELNIRPCGSCGDCSETAECSISDDMKMISEKVNSAGAIIVASPIFFGSVSAQLKIIIDRFQPAWISKFVLGNKNPHVKNVKGLFICVSGQDKDRYFDNARQIVRIFFATLDIEYTGGMFFGGTNSREKVLKEKDGALKSAFEAGANLVKT